jgi:hypothetical protein
MMSNLEVLLLTAMRWFLFFACTSLCAYAPAAGAMVGDYLSYFNIPPPGGHSDTIREKLLDYIEGAQPGSEIRGHITTIGHHAIADALIKVNKERGVAVYLVQDGEELITPRGTCGCENSGFANVCVPPYNGCSAGFTPSCDPLKSANGDGCGGCICQSQSPGQKLEEHFGTRHKFCYVDRGAEGPSPTDLTSCVSSVVRLDNSGAEIDWATHHIKNWLFSHTVVDGKTRTYSTWVTSYNLTKTSDGQFNDVFIVNDNYELYAAYVESFKNFYGQRRTDDFYHVAGRRHHVIPSANTERGYESI